MSQCEYHGHAAFNCPDCQSERVAEAKAALREGRAVVGVFLWQGDGRYPIAASLRNFKRRADAERHAAKLNEGTLTAGYVTRLVYV